MISRRNEATAVQTTGEMSTPNDGGTMSRVILSRPSVGAHTSTQGISFTSVSGNQLMMTRSSMMNWMMKKHGSKTFDTGSTQAGAAAWDASGVVAVASAASVAADRGRASSRAY